ncbi:rCG46696, partial [Rattus norvegicus]
MKKPSAGSQNPLHINWFILGRSPMTVLNAKTHYSRNHISSYITGHTLKRNPTNAMTVEKPSVKNHIFLDIREFLQGKKTVCAESERAFFQKFHITGNQQIIPAGEKHYICAECERPFLEVILCSKSENSR